MAQETDDITQAKADTRAKQRALQEVSKSTNYEQDRQVEELESESRRAEDELRKVRAKIKERRELIARGA